MFLRLQWGNGAWNWNCTHLPHTKWRENISKKAFFFYFFLHFSKSQYFFHLNYNCSNSLDKKNLQEHVEEKFCYQKLFGPFNVQTNCTSDCEYLLKLEAKSREFARILRSLEHFFLRVGQNNFGNKVPFFILLQFHKILLPHKDINGSI